jgi:hypothetical protein
MNAATHPGSETERSKCIHDAGGGILQVVGSRREPHIVRVLNDTVSSKIMDRLRADYGTQPTQGPNPSMTIFEQKF